MKKDAGSDFELAALKAPPGERSISPVPKLFGFLPHGVSPVAPTRFSSLSLISRGNSMLQSPFASATRAQPANPSPHASHPFFRKYKMKTPPMVVFPMGEVREGYEVGSGRKVLIKFFFKPFFSEEELDSLRTEFFPVPELKHPNLLEAVDFHETPAQVIAVSEYFEGQSLESILNDRKALPAGAAALILFQVSQALQLLHGHSLAHRDLKLGNILFDGSTAKLVLTSQLSPFGPKTKFKTCIGSPHYLAPEVLKEAYDFRADVWALGVVLYWVLAGRPPFNAFEEEELFRKILEEDPNFGRTPLKPFETLLRGMLDKSKRRRIALKEIIEDKKVVALAGSEARAAGLSGWQVEGLMDSEIKRGWARLLAGHFLSKPENEREAKKQFEAYLKTAKKEEKLSLKIGKSKIKNIFSTSVEFSKKSSIRNSEFEKQPTREPESKTFSDIREFCCAKFSQNIFSTENAKDLYRTLTNGGDQELKAEVLTEQLLLANHKLNLENSPFRVGKRESINLVEFLDLCKENIPQMGNMI